MPEPVTLAAATAVAEAGNLLIKLSGIVRTVLNIPRRQAQEIAAALNEIQKELQAILGEVQKYRRLSFEADFRLVAPDVLSELEGPKARLRVRANGGSCRVIWNIYGEHLKDWFHKFLARDEYLETERIFKILGDADDQLFATMEQVCTWLSHEARKVRDLVLEEKWNDALKLARSGSGELLAFEESLETTTIKLLDLRNDVLRRSGVTSLRGSAKRNDAE